jgi:molybdenum cofactor cytidylyltransferase
MDMVTAVILAAGLSKRMGKPKMMLPWGEITVIEKVVQTLQDAGMDHLLIVGGDNLDTLKEKLHQYRIRYLLNKDYVEGEMLSSVKVALRALVRENTDAALIVLGDQPQIEADVVMTIIDTYKMSRSEIIVPSFRHHRGHPWLVGKILWKEVINLEPPDTLRDFLSNNKELILHVEVKTPSILEDIDTPDDYARYHP